MPWKGKKGSQTCSSGPGQPHSLHIDYRPSIVPWNLDCRSKFREEIDPSHQPWEFGSSDRNLSGTTDVSLKAWRGAFKLTHIYPSQAAFTSSPVSETTLFLASVRDLFASRNLKVILKDKVKVFSAVTPCQFMLSTNCRPQNSGWIQRSKVKERGGGKMFWQPSSHQWNWRKPYHMNHLKIRSVWTQPWKMYRGEQACIGGGMNRMS